MRDRECQSDSDLDDRSSLFFGFVELFRPTMETWSAFFFAPAHPHLGLLSALETHSDTPQPEQCSRFSQSCPLESRFQSRFPTAFLHPFHGNGTHARPKTQLGAVEIEALVRILPENRIPGVSFIASGLCVSVCVSFRHALKQ